MSKVTPFFCRTEDIPGFKEAVEAEKFSRNASFFALTENILGFECLPMTLEHFLILQIAESPILKGGNMTIPQIAQFLWILSPNYSPKSIWHRGWFFRRCRKTFGLNTEEHQFNAAVIMDMCEAYMADTFQDAQGGGNESKSYYSDVTSVCATLAREHHQPKAVTMKTPLKQIFQDLKEIKEHRYAEFGKPCPLSNRSDEVLANFCRLQNERGN